MTSLAHALDFEGGGGAFTDKIPKKVFHNPKGGLPKSDILAHLGNT